MRVSYRVCTSVEWLSWNIGKKLFICKIRRRRRRSRKKRHWIVSRLLSVHHAIEDRFPLLPIKFHSCDDDDDNATSNKYEQQHIESKKNWKKKLRRRNRNEERVLHVAAENSMMRKNSWLAQSIDKVCTTQTHITIYVVCALLFFILFQRHSRVKHYTFCEKSKKYVCLVHCTVSSVQQQEKLSALTIK